MTTVGRRHDFVMTERGICDGRITHLNPISQRSSGPPTLHLPADEGCTIDIPFLSVVRCAY
jgi:hypothetical protein